MEQWLRASPVLGEDRSSVPRSYDGAAHSCLAPKATDLISKLREESLSSEWSLNAFPTYAQFFSVISTPNVPLY